MEPNIDPDEISLLDLLVTAAESWKLLIFGPIAAGLVGLSVAFLLPATYVSTAVLSLPQDGFNNAIAQAVASSDDFLLGVAQSTGRP
ncbi:MAG: Wzz/FepE/Etk N-terminal domain-containing protein, partial [Burkholderiaceae bacterium]